MFSSPAQLSFEFGQLSGAAFENYIGGVSADEVTRLQAFLSDGAGSALLTGAPGTGKTHLLLAACTQEWRAERGAVFAPLAELEARGPRVLRGLGDRELVALDDIHAVAGERLWEEALFDIWNRCDERRTRLVMALGAGFMSDFTLPDLVSRLVGSERIRLRALPDIYLVEAVNELAHRRGLSLTAGVVHYLLRRVSRDMHSLDSLIADLDRASLAHQRHLTIPFVRDWLAGPRVTSS
ncbi:MAG: DnaA regulatory inactivator Hda [Gammaproteobacteria bacterium]|nr:DnaA regulatory inactivator Hda [Gammaproteobacteria bacterium]